MNNSLPVPGQLWYDMQSLELKFFDGTDWQIIKKMKPIKNDLKNYLNFKRKFALFPHRCAISKRIIWLEYAQCAEPSYIVLGDDELLKSKPIWHDEYEHLNWEIINGV